MLTAATEFLHSPTEFLLFTTLLSISNSLRPRFFKIIFLEYCKAILQNCSFARGATPVLETPRIAHLRRRSPSAFKMKFLSLLLMDYYFIQMFLLNFAEFVKIAQKYAIFEPFWTPFGNIFQHKQLISPRRYLKSTFQKYFENSARLS